MNTFIQQCIDILQKDEVKQNCKNLAKPFVEMILYESMPYIYFLTFFVLICFLLNLATFIIILKNKNISLKLI